ncbi:uncharacterized, partial [Tachysurus ichikawai]
SLREQVNGVRGHRAVTQLPSELHQGPDMPLRDLCARRVR